MALPVYAEVDFLPDAPDEVELLEDEQGTASGEDTVPPEQNAATPEPEQSAEPEQPAPTETPEPTAEPALTPEPAATACGGCRFRGQGGFCRGLRRFGRGGLLRLGALFRFRGGGVLLRRNGILPGGRSLLILQQLYFVRCVGQKIHLGVYRQGHCHNQASGDKQRCQPARPTCCVFPCSIQSAHSPFALV